MRNISIHNDFGRKILELTEDELIIKRFLHKKKVKRSNIRSAYLWEESLNILTYDNKLITAGNSFIKWSERDNVKRIIDEINKEDIIFNFGGKVIPTWAFSFYSIILLGNIVTNTRFETVFIKSLFFIAMLICLISMFTESEKYKHIKYYINHKELQWKNNKNRSNESCFINDIKFIKNYDRAIKYKVKNSKYTFYIIKKIDYPLSYKFALEELRDVASEKMSINK